MSEEYYDEAPTRSETPGWRDFAFALFRRKWMILGIGFLGVLGALFLRVREEPKYQSEAALWVLYAAGGVDEPKRSDPEANRGTTMLNNETMVLESYELALLTARAIVESNQTSLVVTDPARLARRIQGGLTVKVPRTTATVVLTYTDDDPEMPQLVLEELVAHYMTQHYDKHRATTALQQLHDRLKETEEEFDRANRELYKLREEADVRNIDQKHTMLEARISSLQDEIRRVEVEMATLDERIRRTSIEVGPAPEEVVEQQRVDPLVFEDHQQIVREIQEALQQRALLLRDYTEDHALVKGQNSRIQGLNQRRESLEAEHPALAAVTASRTLATAVPATSAMDVGAARRELGVLEARKKQLEGQLSVTREEASALTAVELEIRDKEREVANLEAIVTERSGVYGRAKTSEVYNPGNVPNIVVIDPPTPVVPVFDSLALVKQLFVVVAAFGLGIGLALVLELVVDQVVRRPAELEKRLNIPLMISVPRLAGVDNFALALPAPMRPMVTHRKEPKSNRPVMILPSLVTHAEQAYEPPAAGGDRHEPVQAPRVAPWDMTHVMRPYFEALRDRLMLFFQLQNVNHKPKLVAVTGCAEGAVATTIAAGLASALSEVGEGNVLLVDLNFGRGAVHPFFRGEPTRTLDKALDPAARDESRVQERLYLASGRPEEGEMSSPLPKRLSTLMPKMRASDYEYIVFDMPPISETSATVALAAHMDKTLLVIEAERTHRHEATQAFDKLREYKADVMGILNKHHSKEPRWLTADA